MKYVIVMADIIGSSDVDGKELMEEFSDLVEKTNRSFQDIILSPLTITLGDEFQGVVKQVTGAVDIIFYLDEQCLDAGIRLRHVIEYGEIDTDLNTERAHGMLGDGLTSAREQLERLKDSSQEIAVEGFENESWVRQINLAFQLYRSFYNSWHEKDHKIAYDFIQLRDYKVLADRYEKDVSTMWRKEKTLKMKDFYASRELLKLIAGHAGNNN
jgi:hypothetical protein